MKYYTDTYSGVDNIFDDILDKKNKETINKSDFVYIQRLNNITPDKIDNIQYFNNFIDPHNKLCQTGNYCLGNKSDFYNYFLKYYKSEPEYIPKTYSFTKNNILSIKYLFNKNKIWILKPTNAFARKGITIINNFEDLKKWILKYNQFNNWVIQKYIENPLLYNNKKFHIRFYCLAVKSKDTFKVYLYKDGFFYLSSLHYDKNDLNLSRHLTGAKYCYVHQVYPDLHKYLSKKNFNKLIKKSEEIIIDTMSICEDILKCPNKNKVKFNGKCFHLFAFDLLPDVNYNLHLLEVNNGTVGMETINYRPDLCINKSSKRLHNISIIRQLHKDLIDVVVNDNKNTKFRQINLKNLNEKIIENFNNKSINNNNIYVIIYFMLIILILYMIYKKL